MLKIRKAVPEDLDKLMNIFEQSRSIMRKSGNMNQWTGGYPTTDIVLKDIDNGNCYVCLNECGELVGTFALIIGKDPTYTTIYEGKWLDDTQPYGTIHRLGSTPDSHGVASACFEWCFKQIPNLRIDTHRDNHILQHILEKQGFTYCGIIYLLSGDERLAYQKIIKT
ncbi:GNAT family N-acetyltransferase [Histomonas meleagridis]|uniref:GNAT family N-acetyltransferase n=1 Tax=Histomonas meleagridis TaxID=135588 RepID=UPI00355A2FE3|nr:GNAT family N-acetyltransferase [Histomonas meleagridis]KAH0806549.1 GNAT family N-acetyltransferase [Histomonas meleagridis]